MQMNRLFLPQELNIKRAFFAFSVAFLILNSWNIWFTFTAKGSWCLSVLAKNKIIYEFNNFISIFFEVSIIAQGCAELQKLTVVIMSRLRT